MRPSPPKIRMRMPSQTQERSAACCSRCFSPEVTRTEIGLVLLSFAIGCPVMGSADTQQSPIPRFFLWLACSEHCLEISCNVNRLATKASPCNQIFARQTSACCVLSSPPSAVHRAARRAPANDGSGFLPSRAGAFFRVKGHSLALSPASTLAQTRSDRSSHAAYCAIMPWADPTTDSFADGA
jgi:hypothetical protein